MTKSFNPGLKDHPGHEHHHYNEEFHSYANGRPVPPYMDGMDRWCDHHPPHCHDNEMSFKT